MADIYNVLGINYVPDGKMKIGKRNVDAFRVEFDKLGTANSMKEAKKKFGHICKHPALQFASNEAEMIRKIISEQDFGY